MADDLLDWLARVAGAFEAEGVHYAIAGGLGLAAWGCARATTDLDFVIASSAESIAAARNAATHAGLHQTRRAPVRFRRISLLRMIVVPERAPEPIPVDLLLLPPAIEDSVLDRVRKLPVAGVAAAFASAEDLVLLKRAPPPAPSAPGAAPLSDGDHRLATPVSRRGQSPRSSWAWCRSGAST